MIQFSNDQNWVLSSAVCTVVLTVLFSYFKILVRTHKILVIQHSQLLQSQLLFEQLSCSDTLRAPVFMISFHMSRYLNT